MYVTGLRLLTVAGLGRPVMVERNGVWDRTEGFDEVGGGEGRNLREGTKDNGKGEEGSMGY
jgi:hypothetical protein